MRKGPKFMCVYAGPGMMGDGKLSPPAEPSAPQNEQGSDAFCPSCGAPAKPGARFCDQCGTDLARSKKACSDETPELLTGDPEMAAGVYAGPDMTGMNAPFIPAEKPPYPINYQTDDEDPMDVYAGPPVGFDE